MEKMDRVELIAQGKRLANEYVENADISKGLDTLPMLAKQNPSAAIKQTAYQILLQAKDNLGCDLPPARPNK